MNLKIENKDNYKKQEKIRKKYKYINSLPLYRVTDWQQDQQIHTDKWFKKIHRSDSTLSNLNDQILFSFHSSVNEDRLE